MILQKSPEGQKCGFASPAGAHDPELAQSNPDNLNPFSSRLLFYFAILF
jgi:hypothetical protein